MNLITLQVRIVELQRNVHATILVIPELSLQLIRQGLDLRLSVHLRLVLLHLVHKFLLVLFILVIIHENAENPFFL